MIWNYKAFFNDVDDYSQQRLPEVGEPLSMKVRFWRDAYFDDANGLPQLLYPLWRSEASLLPEWKNPRTRWSAERQHSQKQGGIHVCGLLHDDFSKLADLCSQFKG